MPETLAYSEARKHAEVNQRLRLPLRAVIRQVLPDLESVEVQLALEPGASRLRVRHPYVGPNSWIRVMPEAGTEVLTIQRGDDYLNEIVSYYSYSPGGDVSDYKKGNQLYRPLNSGEIELISSGRAYLFLGEGGDVETRGGTIRHELLQSRLELRSVAPTYVKKLHSSPPYLLANEERFGVVKRPDLVFKNSMQQFVKLPAPATEFAVEYSRWLNNKAGMPLVELQEGSVVDSLGAFTKQSSTNKDLRYHKKVYHKYAGYLVHQVDEELNVLISNTSTATETKADLGAKNVLRLTAKDIKATLFGGGVYSYSSYLTTSAPTTKFKANTFFFVEAPKAHFKVPLVGFGKKPLRPIALADPLLAYLLVTYGVLSNLARILQTAFPPPSPIGVWAATSTFSLSSVVEKIGEIASKEVLASG